MPYELLISVFQILNDLIKVPSTFQTDFATFGITIFSFMIAGGTLLFIIAIELLTYGEWRFAGSVKEEIGVVPIAFPLLAGPR